MFRTNNLAADCDAWDREHAIQAERFPVCVHCTERIFDDHYYIIEGDPVCPECLQIYYRKENID